MAARARHDVEKGERLVILVDLVARQFAAQNFGEDIVGIVSRHALSPSRVPDAVQRETINAFTGVRRAMRSDAPLIRDRRGLGRSLRCAWDTYHPLRKGAASASSAPAAAT